MGDSELLGAQWRQIAEELAIDCIAPFFIDTVAGQRFEFACLIPGFGTPRGTLVSVTYIREAVEEAKARGYTCSSMHPETRLLPLDSESFRECLREWGWCRSGVAPPAWYSEHEV